MKEQPTDSGLTGLGLASLKGLTSICIIDDKKYRFSKKDYKSSLINCCLPKFEKKKKMEVIKWALRF